MIFNKPTFFEKDFAAISDLYPKLRYTRDEKHKSWLISGELDICDATGLYWDTFNILIIVRHPYPVNVPDVFERSTIIPRTEAWHISEHGECCLDIPHNLKLAFKRGMRLAGFMHEKVYPYLANQLHRLSRQDYAGEEYDHRFEGVLQYYKEELNLPTPMLAKQFIKSILDKKTLDRNRACLCGSGQKTKKCHLAVLQTLTELGEKVLRQDLLNFEQWELSLAAND
jgi:hypothetical protein